MIYTKLFNQVKFSSCVCFVQDLVLLHRSRTRDWDANTAPPLFVLARDSQLNWISTSLLEIGVLPGVATFSPRARFKSFQTVILFTLLFLCRLFVSMGVI